MGHEICRTGLIPSSKTAASPQPALLLTQQLGIGSYADQSQGAFPQIDDKYSLGTSTIQYINTQDTLFGRTNPPSLFQYNLRSSFYSGLLIQFPFTAPKLVSLNPMYWLLVLFPMLLGISFRKSLPTLINWSICLFFPSSFRVSGLTLSLIHFELCAEGKKRILYMWLSVFLTSVVEMLIFLQCIFLASLGIFLKHKLN